MMLTFFFMFFSHLCGALANLKCSLVSQILPDEILLRFKLSKDF